MLKFDDLRALEKGAVSPFVQSGNLEISYLTGFEPGTLRVTVGSLIHYTKFPYGKKVENLKKISIRKFGIVDKLRDTTVTRKVQGSNLVRYDVSRFPD